MKTIYRNLERKKENILEPVSREFSLPFNSDMLPEKAENERLVKGLILIQLLKETLF